MPDSITAAEVAILAAGNLKHGLNAESIIIPSEIENDWLAHLDDTVDHYEPKSSIERALAYRIAELFWRLRRCARAETNSINEDDARNDKYEAAELRLNQCVIGGPAIRAVLGETTMNAVIRYEAHLNRMLYQAMHELEALQASRSGKTSPLARVQVHGLPGS